MTEYEKYITQKYSIAVALALIKSKPQGLTLTEYINELRNKIDSQICVFHDIYISESDFIDSDDEQINDKGFKKGTNQSELPEFVCNISNLNTASNNLDGIVEGKIDQNNRLDNKRIVNNINEEFEIDNILCNADINDSVSILRDINIDNANPSQDLVRNHSIQEILDIFKEIDTSCINEGFISTSTPNNITQSTFCETNQINITNKVEVNNEVTICAYDKKDDHYKDDAFTKKCCNTHDSQETEVYTLDGYTDNFTYISQSQDNITIPKKLFHNFNQRLNILKDNNGKTRNELEKVVVNEDTDKTNQFNDINRNSKSEHNERTEKQLFNKICNDNNDIENIQFPEARSSNAFSNECVTVTKKTCVKANSLGSSTDEYGFSFNDITINVPNRKLTSEEPHIINNKSFSESFDQAEACSSNSFQGNSFYKILQNNKTNNILYDVGSENNPPIEVNNFILSENQFIFLNSVEEQPAIDTEINNDRNNNNMTVEIDAERDGQVKNDKQNCECDNFSSGYETQWTNKNDRILENPNEIENKSDGTVTLEKIVPFKVLEELNRAKKYISRQDRRLSDSGRSNSQGSQLSGVRMNDAGNYLLNYLVENPLYQRTVGITEEVSQVLGKFVDKLHDDEYYPQFIEKILQKVHELVTDIYEGDRNEDLLRKDDQIDRLLLLNRSTHITMYTIEKILPILQEVYVKLQKKDFVEITCLVKSENLCYILHALEILLKRYNSMASSQTSMQTSQDDDRSLKRSTITEIWRRKWNLSKNDVSEGSFKKKCVLTQTSEALNKIIVQGMDGYSLVSYAALQAFNLLQSK